MTDRFSLTLPPSRTSPKQARDAVAAHFSGEHRCGELLLCLSEVVTNAIRHAATGVRLTVARHDDRVRVEVADSSPVLPVRRTPAPDAPSGRGLRILDQLTAAWGTRPTAEGKVVWFDFDLAEASR
jgi:anti-sigma regulatory factor (Ser/Thr protein kinase)